MAFFSANTTFHVTLMGCTNTGKSTLFNRLVGKSYAIEGRVPHLTRDVRVHRVDNIEFADCPGIHPDWIQSPKKHPHATQLLSELLGDTHLVLWIVDGKKGIESDDMAVFRYFVRHGCPWIAVVNKVDHDQIRLQFVPSGPKGEWIYVSAAHKQGISELLAVVATHRDAIQKPTSTSPSNPLVRVVCVGRTNVGKSSFCNQVMGHGRVRVSPDPNTTRDMITMEWSVLADHTVHLIDTAGLLMSAPQKIPRKEMAVGMLQTRRAIEQSEVAFFLVDATIGFSERDRKIYSLLRTTYTTVIIIVNKWDLPSRIWQTQSQARCALWAHTLIPHHVIFHSTLAPFRQGLFEKLLAAIVSERHRTISTTRINAWVQNVRTHPGFLAVRSVLALKFAVQKGINPIRVYCFAKFRRASTPQTLRHIKTSLVRSFMDAFELRYGPVFLGFRK